MKKFICGLVLGASLAGFSVWAWDQTPQQNQIEIDYFQLKNEQKQQQIDQLQREQYYRERHIKEPC